MSALIRSSALRSKVQMGPPTIELQNIQQETQAAGLFAIPGVHRQMDVGGRCRRLPWEALLRVATVDASV
jgi:hypothetical protein